MYIDFFYVGSRPVMRKDRIISFGLINVFSLSWNVGGGYSCYFLSDSGVVARIVLSMMRMGE